MAHPLYPVLTSMPGVGVPAAAIFLAETLGRTFPTGAQLASYAGLTPITRRSGTSIRGQVRLPRRQQAPQESHVPLSLRLGYRYDPASRAYYDRKRAQGKRHNQAILALAHRRILTLYAMIRDGSLNDPQPAQQQLPAAA